MLQRLEALWAAGLTALVVAVLLFAPVPVTLDGYSHLYHAYLLNALVHGDPQIEAAFSLNSFLLPNWLTTLSLAALRLVLPPMLALDVLVAAAFLACLAALRYAVRAASPEPLAPPSMVALLPFALPGFLTMGFLGYVFSSSLALYALGRLLSASQRQQATLALALLAAYFFHPLPVAVSFLFALLRALPRNPRMLLPWAPVVALLGWFLARFATGGALHWQPSLGLLIERVVSAAKPDQLIDLAPTPTAVIPYALLLGALLASLATSSPRPRRPLLSAAVLLLAGYLVTPDALGDASLIDLRLLSWAVTLLTIAAVAHAGPRALRLCAALSTIIVLLFCAEYLLVSVRLASAMADLRSALSILPRGEPTLILGFRRQPLCPEWGLAERIAPQRHWAMLGALEAGVVVINDYQPASSHFPLRYGKRRFRPPVDELRPPPSPSRAAWAEALADPANSAKAVVVWGAPTALATDCPEPAEPPFTEILARRYDRVYENTSASYAAIWRRRR